MPIRSRISHHMTYQSKLRGYGHVKVTPKRDIVLKRVQEMERETKEVIASGVDLWRLQDLSRDICNSKAELRTLEASQGYAVDKVVVQSLTDKLWRRPKRAKLPRKSKKG